MRNKKILINCLLFLSLKEGVICQSSNEDNDPRNYVKVLECRKNAEEKLIWAFNPSTLIPDSGKNIQNITNRVPEPISIVDESSQIKILFDKNAINRNAEFKGNITIRGIISGKGGNDPVEVLPYTKVGEQLQSIGIPNRPASELSTLLLNLILSCSEFTQEDSTYTLISEINNLISDIKDSKVPEDYFLKPDDDRGFRRRIRFVKDWLEREEKIYFPVFLSQSLDPATASATKNQILNGLDELFLYVNNMTLKETIEKIELILNYIQYFREGGELAEETFLLVIGKDYLQIDAIKNSLEKIRDTLKSYYSNKPSEASMELVDNINMSKDVVNKLLRVKDSYIDVTLMDYDSTLRKISQNLRDYGFKNKEYENEIIKRIYKFKVELTEDLSKKASEILNKNLFTATIDLLKERAKEGDFLYLELVIESYDKRETNKDPNTILRKTFPIGRYEIRKTGWQINIFDSSVLINRINENQDLSGTVSPSNFKGSSGASYIFTWRRDNRTTRQFWNTIQPSIGLNASYLDFSTEADLEVGIGLLVGILDNNVHCILGINLNNTAPSEQSPYYIGIGVSFAKFIDRYFTKN